MHRIHASAPARKRVTRGSPESIFSHRDDKPVAHDDVPVLDKKMSGTGSIVLDVVREYTEKHPLCVLLVQVGDFYELYESHAARYASQLDLKLTRKEVASGVTVDFAGFPLRSLDRYLDILVNRLHCRVALCEQYSTATREDGSVIGIRRRITRIITPGTVIEDRFLDSHEYNYLLAVCPATRSTMDDGKVMVGLAWIDLSVGEFVMQQTQLATFKDDIARIRPREVILPDWMKLDQDAPVENTDDPITHTLRSDPTITISYQTPPSDDTPAALMTLKTMFKNIYPDHGADENALAFDLSKFSSTELGACMALLTYIDNTHLERKPKLQMPVHFSVEDTLRIDSAAMTSLELVKGQKDGRRAESLLGVIDQTVTSAGSRLLTRWLTSPLTCPTAIGERLDVVQFFKDDTHLLHETKDLLKQSTDVQRALQRLALRRGQHSDLTEICYTLEITKRIQHRLCKGHPAVLALTTELDPHDGLVRHLREAFDHDKIVSKEPREKEYGFVNRTFNPVLSRLYDQLDSLELQRENLQVELRMLCGNSLALISNAPYRHVVEVNASQAAKLMDRYHCVLVNQTKTKRRFQISEWTDLSVQLENTRLNIMEIEQQIFEQAVENLLDQASTIIRSCRVLAQLDVLASFATLAYQNQYTRPVITLRNETVIVGGRHPVVEAHLARKGRAFVRNDCSLKADQRIWLLTGPNMGGKSTFLRQNVVIVILAHMGCFVPAKSARIGVTDRIFSRVGAADNLAQDQSTFMVEMVETANILKNATARSLVIMDEVGRGTSTADGISIAYAVIDYLHKHTRCRTLFATHYHELADSVATFKKVKFFMTDLHEDSHGGFVFLHHVRPGVCRYSHGLKVAQLAGLPPSVIDTARTMWNKLSSQNEISTPGSLNEK